MDNFFLSENLRILRKRMSLSQEELADKIGLNRGNIASYENGTAEPRICNLVKFAHLFNISVFDLTHSNLKDDFSYQRALLLNNSHKNGTIERQEMEKFVKAADDFNNAVKGLNCLYRIKSGNSENNDGEAQILKDHFDQLYGLTQHILQSYNELIALFFEHFAESHQKDLLEEKDS
jgi:transcriptional regulator with XRE-family HTH domain